MIIFFTRVSLTAAGFLMYCFCLLSKMPALGLALAALLILAALLMTEGDE